MISAKTAQRSWKLSITDVAVCRSEFVRAHFYGNKQQKQWVPFPRMVLCMAGVGDAFANAVVILVRVKPLNRRNIWNESP